MQTIRRHVFSALGLTCIAIPGVTTCLSSERLVAGTPSPGGGVKLVVGEFQAGLFPLVHDKRAAGNFAPDEGLGLGPKTYRKIFELLLRLRANYIWPAMHRGTKPFNY